MGPSAMLAAIGRIGADPADDEDLRLRKRYLVGVSVSILPFGLLLLLLPLALHVALGGFVPSSGILLWSVLSPLAALVFTDLRQAVAWLGGFLGVLVVGALVQEGLPHRAAFEAPVLAAFFVLNIGSISTIGFLMLAIYVRALGTERRRSESLLLNVLPKPIADRLKREPGIIADPYEAATVIFADVVNSTPLTVELSPRELVGLLDEYVRHFDTLSERYGVEKIRTIGDNYMAVAGVPRPRPDHAQAVARLALGMLAYCDERRSTGARCLDFRIGLNSGPVVGGVIGQSKFVFDIWGDPVNTASRMESHGEAGRIQITEATYSLIKDEFVCEPRGVIEVKGKGPLRTYFLVEARAPA